MSLLDRAFVKAYTRSHSPTPHEADKRQSLPVDPSADQASGTKLFAELPPIQDAVAWGDLSDITYFRVDVGHIQSPRPSGRTAAPVNPAAAPMSAAAAPMGTAVGQPAAAVPVATNQAPTADTRFNQQSMPGTATASGTPNYEQPSYQEHSSRTTRSAISHTLTAYEAAPSDVDDSTMRFRIDEPHLKQVWTPPVIEEPQEYFRPRRSPEESAEFARAKMEALAQQNLKSVEPQSASFASHINRASTRAFPAAAPRAATPPISTQNATSRRKPFEPLWEVDTFDFSDTIVELFGDAKLMKSIGTPLDEAVASGLRSILITSASRGAGRTSVAIGIAVSAAAAGLRVALVDADTRNAGVADALRLDVPEGWQAAIQNGMPLDEVAIRSIEDQFVVVPAKMDSLANPTKPAEFDYLVNRLREAFDLVIVDGSAWSDDSSLSQTQLVDAAIMVVDVRNRDSSQEAEMQDALRRAGVAGLGIVENFA